MTDAGMVRANCTEAVETVHASAVVVGEAGVLIRGMPGAGKSELAAHLVGEARRRGLFARLVGDDRIVMARTGAGPAARIILRPHPRIAGLIERRWEGIAAVPHEPAAVLRCAIDIHKSVNAPARLPEEAGKRFVWCEIAVPRLVLPNSLTLDSRTVRIFDFLNLV